MKKAIILVITAVVKLLLLSLICSLTYEWNDLSKVFGPVISYSQWVGIVVIINAIVPSGIVNTKSTDDK